MKLAAENYNNNEARNQNMKFIALVNLLVLLTVPTSWAATYKWVDSHGQAHFTGNPDAIPNEFRKPEEQANGSTNAPQNLAFTLRGRIMDSRKILLQGLMDEGVIWAGNLDSADGRVGRQVVAIHAYSGGSEIVSTHPDEKGEFTVKANTVITRLILEVSGGGLFIQANGSWSSDANVVLDLDKNVFVVDGYLKSLSGDPVQREMVTAYDTEHKAMVFAYTDSRGYFRFWSNQAIASLETQIDNLPLLQKGPWNENASITLARNQSGMFTLKGLVSDGAGKPVAGVRISATFEDRSGKSAISDSTGHYAISVDKKVIRLYGYHDLTQQEVIQPGAWSGDANVDFTFN